MFELTINNQVYQFRFGMGFLKEINKRVTISVEGAPGVKQNIGLRYAIASILEGDVLALVDVLDVANKGMEPRLTRGALEEYVEDDSTDIDKLFEDVLDFLKKANCTKKTAMEILSAQEKTNSKR